MHNKPTENVVHHRLIWRLPRNRGVKAREKSRAFTYRHVVLYKHSEHYAEFSGLKSSAPKEAR
jgi:hypothetical protein